MEIKTLFSSSSRIAPSFGSITAGKYNIEPVPEEFDSKVSATGTYLLRFSDDIEKGPGHSNPFKETDVFLSFLSLVLDSEIHVKGVMANSVNSPSDIVSGQPQQPRIVIKDDPEVDKHLGNMSHLDEIMAKQILRACGVYSAALHNTNRNPTLSFFLLAVAVECVSNKVMDEGGPRKKFIDFLSKFGESSHDLDPDKFRKLIREIYDRHRSGFTHGGKEVPNAAIMADRLNRPYIRHLEEDKEKLTPGLRWFQNVVRTSLLNFAADGSYHESNPNDHIKNLSLEFGFLKLKVKKSLDAGSVATTHNFELD